jgi:hypothetical protein
MTLNVKDSGASPIADATVTFRQKEGREHWTCKTDSNGDVLDPKGDPIWLIEKEETSNGVFTQWSDGSGNQVHVIEVMKDGYDPHYEEIAMTADKTANVVLAVEGSGAAGTIIYDSTLYDSTIY